MGRWGLGIGSLVLAACGVSVADEKPSGRGALPEGPGLAAKYPGDRGIEKDPDVILAEDFESGEIADLSKKWSEVSNKDGKVLAFAEDTPPGSPGKRVLQVTATLGQDTGGHLFANLPRHVDTAFARFYVKFPKKTEYIHHFVWLGGLNPATRWPNPKAGVRPLGDDRVSVGIEPWGNRGRDEPPGVWTFYTYWHEMKISADGRHWGNGLHPVEDQVVPRDRWQCVEVMVKLNTKPDLADGRLALWLDGVLVADFEKGAHRGPWTGLGFHLLKSGGEPFEGFRWRTSDDLKITYFWLEHYVTENAARQNGVAKPDPVNRVWFDHVVVSTKYVGPMSPVPR